MFWNFTQGTEMIPSCFVEDFKTIVQLKEMLWTDDI